MRGDDHALPRDLPPLPTGWNWHSLGDLIERGRAISYGIVQPGSYDLAGVPVLRADNVQNGHIQIDDVFRVSVDVESGYMRTRLRGGEVLLTVVGAYLGRAATAPAGVSGWNVVRAVAVIPVGREIESEWVSLCLRSPAVQRYIWNWVTTTAQPTLNLRDVARLPIPLPPKTEREWLTNLLSGIEKKIELNRRMNETLEAIARAIFKSWFVDFDPIRAEADGRRPAGISGEVAALFPSSFDNVGDPDVPSGWRVGKFAELATISREAVNPSEFPNETCDHYSIPAFDEGREPVSELGVAIKSNKFVIGADVVLLSKLNPRIPRIWMPEIGSTQRAICSTEFLVLRPTAVSREYLYGLCSSEFFLQEFATMVTGTSGSHQRVKPEFLEGMEVVVPDNKIVRRYTELVAPLHRRITVNLRESHILVALRDTLLPKLLSGEVRVKQAERAMEAAL